MNYRKITAADDEAIARIIRNNLEKLHLDIPGTAYFDPELDHLSVYYDAKPEERIYFIALDEDGKVAGGVGAARFEHLPDCAELQKLYLDDSTKGRGYGRALMQLIEDWTREAGYKQLYLETHSSLMAAIGLYEKLGFDKIEKPEAALHGTMDRFFLKKL